MHYFYNSSGLEIRDQQPRASRLSPVVEKSVEFYQVFRRTLLTDSTSGGHTVVPVAGNVVVNCRSAVTGL